MKTVFVKEVVLSANIIREVFANIKHKVTVVTNMFGENRRTSYNTFIGNGLTLLITEDLLVAEGLVKVTVERSAEDWVPSSVVFNTIESKNVLEQIILSMGDESLRK